MEIGDKSEEADVWCNMYDRSRYSERKHVNNVCTHTHINKMKAFESFWNTTFYSWALFIMR